MRILLLTFGLLAVVYTLHRLALAAEARGWIYYRDSHPPAGAGSLGAMRVAELFKPELEYVIEETVAGDLRVVDDENGQIYPPNDAQHTP